MLNLFWGIILTMWYVKLKRATIISPTPFVLY